MTPMRWFRKHTKKLLAIVCVPVMIIFLLPSFARQNQRGMLDPVLGYVMVDGEEQEVRQKQLQEAGAKLSVLRSLGVDMISQAGVLVQIPQLGVSAPMPAVAGHALFFGQLQANQSFRAGLRQQAAQWVDDREALEAVWADIDAVAEGGEGGAALYYWLLAGEARRAGVQATGAQIDALLDVRGQLIAAGNPLPRISIADIISQTVGTEGKLREAIGEYIAIMRYASMVSKSLVLSDPELRRMVRDKTEMMTVSGEFVAFPPRLFTDRIEEPTEEEIAGQFAKFREAEQGDVTDENPYGFGYMLGDRVQVEYLKVDVAAVAEVVAEEFGKLSVLVQESKVREYWSNNRERFRVQVEGSADVDGQESQPEFRDPPFDEVVLRAREQYQHAEAVRRAELIASEAKSLSQQKVGAKDSTSEVGSEARSDYAVIAKRLSNDAVTVLHESTDYLSMNEAGADVDLGMAYMTRNGRPIESLLGVMFGCKPLKDGETSKLDSPPVELYDDVAPLVGFNRMMQEQAVYVVRIIGADRKRAPESLSDTGRGGAAAAALDTAVDEGNALRQQVIEDVRTVKQFELSREWAERFAAETEKSDWDTALAMMNDALSDPCVVIEPLSVDKLESVRDRMQQLQEMMENQQQGQGGQWMQRLFLENAALVRASMKLAQERGAGSGEGVAVLADERLGRCVAFRGLGVTPPSMDEYLTQRPLVAEAGLLRKHGVLTLAHYNPKNIEKRSGFRRENGDELEEE